MLSRLVPVIGQSGVVPYRIRNGEIEILLITSSKGRHWVIPKGLIEPFMTPADSAAKEAWEEAGIVGTVVSTAMGTYFSEKWGFCCQIEVFLMRVELVLEHYPEANIRQRRWFSLPKAIKRIEAADLQHILATVPEQRLL